MVRVSNQGDHIEITLEDITNARDDVVLVNPIYLAWATGSIRLDKLDVTPLPLVRVYCDNPLSSDKKPCTIALVGPVPGEFVELSPGDSALVVRYLALAAVVKIPNDISEWNAFAPALRIEGGSFIAFAPGRALRIDNKGDSTVRYYTIEANRLVAWTYFENSPDDPWIRHTRFVRVPYYYTTVYSLYPFPASVEDRLEELYRNWMVANYKAVRKLSHSILERLNAKYTGKLRRPLIDLDDVWYIKYSWYQYPTPNQG